MNDLKLSADAVARAQELLDRACGLYPAGPRALSRAVGLALDTMGQYRRGRRRPPPTVLRMVADVIATTPAAAEVVDALRTLAEEAERSGALRRRRARPVEQALSFLAAPDAASAEYHQAAGLLIAGRELEHRKDLDAAGRAFRAAAARSTRLRYVALTAMMMMYLRAGRSAEAQAEVDRILAAGAPDSQVLDVLYWDGRLAQQARDYPRARERFTRVLAVAPGYMDAFIRWAAVAGYRSALVDSEPAAPPGPNGASIGAA